jgi:hypothetical protein
LQWIFFSVAGKTSTKCCILLLGGPKSNSNSCYCCCTTDPNFAKKAPKDNARAANAGYRTFKSFSFIIVEKIVDKPLRIRGVAKTTGISRNSNIYTAEELGKSTDKLEIEPTASLLILRFLLFADYAVLVGLVFALLANDICFYKLAPATHGRRGLDKPFWLSYLLLFKYFLKIQRFEISGGMNNCSPFYT